MTDTANILDMNEDELLAQFKARDRLIESLGQKLAESDTATLRLIETIKYLVGIAERGEGRKQLDGETVETFVLGYVKRIEQQLGECKAKLEMAEAVIAGDGALITGLKDDLAECQAREKVLRDALGVAWGNKLLAHEAYEIAEKALAMPSDSTALDTMLKQAKREALLEAASAVKKDADRVGSTWVSGLHADTIRRMAKELE
jgi:hypothetical protein